MDTDSIITVDAKGRHQIVADRREREREGFNVLKDIKTIIDDDKPPKISPNSKNHKRSNLPNTDDVCATTKSNKHMSKDEVNALITVTQDSKHSVSFADPEAKPVDPVAALQRTVQAMSVALVKAENDIKTLTTTLAEANSIISSLNRDVTSIKTELDKNKPVLNTIKAADVAPKMINQPIKQVEQAPKPIEAKHVEQAPKPVEVKVLEQKVKPTEVKSTEAQQVVQMPKPTETKSTETKVSELKVKPTEIKSTEDKPTEVRQMEDKLTHTRQMEVKMPDPQIKALEAPTKPVAKVNITSTKPAATTLPVAVENSLVSPAADISKPEKPEAENISFTNTAAPLASGAFASLVPAMPTKKIFTAENLVYYGNQVCGKVRKANDGVALDLVIPAAGMVVLFTAGWAPLGIPAPIEIITKTGDGNNHKVELIIDASEKTEANKDQPQNYIINAPALPIYPLKVDKFVTYED